MFVRKIETTIRPLRRYLHAHNNPDFVNAIQELNKEMESVFGNPPPVSNGSSIDNLAMGQESQFVPPSVDSSEHRVTHISNTVDPLPATSASSINKVSMVRESQSIPRLTHVSTTGEAQMVDVSSKESSKRVAIASCKVILGKEVFDLVAGNRLAKGDVLTVAKIAGINGAKQTSNLIPLCHNINLTHVRVDLTLSEKDFSVEIEGESSSTGKTGVEMEALTAVTIAGLTVYDMCKAASKDIKITDIKLDHKSGGKSGEWSRKQ